MSCVYFVRNAARPKEHFQTSHVLGAALMLAQSCDDAAFSMGSVSAFAVKRLGTPLLTKSSDALDARAFAKLFSAAHNGTVGLATARLINVTACQTREGTTMWNRRSTSRVATALGGPEQRSTCSQKSHGGNACMYPATAR